MARAIDADILLQNFDDMEPYEEYESEHDLWLDMRMEVIHAPTLTPPNEWVSVEDAMPPELKMVLVYCGGLFGITKSMFHDRRGYRPKGVRVYHG